MFQSCFCPEATNDQQNFERGLVCFVFGIVGEDNAKHVKWELGIVVGFRMRALVGE
jgi:hypothetical protein